MDNRFTIIKDLVIQACERLKKDGISVPSSMVDEAVKSLTSGNSSIEQVRSEILNMESAWRESHKKPAEEKTETLEIARNLQNLSVQHKGITLHMQDIDLMAIACSNDFSELENAMKNIGNISLPAILENEDFSQYRQRVFDSYLDSLTFRSDYIKNNDLALLRKVEYLFGSGLLTNEEKVIVQQILRDNKENGHGAIVSSLSAAFGEERCHEMIKTIWKFDPIEKEGVKGTSVEFYRGLSEQVRYFYDSITIDEECKYGRVMLQDGSFEDERLRKSLEYAKSMGKTVRMNALMFYMDCPDEVYNLEQNSTSSAIAREKLETYVDSVTRVMADYPGVVRSVDVFNELLNRFAMSGDVPYMVRGDIPQDLVSEDFDNIKSGWMKHLTVEDICEVMQVARRNLPNVEFMYNDDNLTDPKKLSATIELIRRIQDYSKGLGIQLIDSIGTQMHIDNNVSKEEIKNMFLTLKELGLPIEITEFDLAMTSGIEGLTPEQIEVLRQKKINEVFEVVEELKDECNIRGFTIWSKTDSQNFRVTLANEIAHREGKDFISTLHGGMFTGDMVPKSAEMAKLVRKQNFNYHGHTSRCGHASELSDELYVLAARNQGLSRIGFSDHVAFGPLENWQQGKRMHVSEVDGYIASIRKLQKDNPDIEIRCGFEAEYDPSKKGYLAELRKSCDYMILGQHYVQSGMGIVDAKDNPDYPLIYASMVCEAMETGIFDIVAHPDYFMLERDKCSSDESYALFMENARKASLMICTKAKEMGIPLELNVRGAKEYKEGRDTEFTYPHSLFWDVASEVGNEVIYAVDAHHPGHIMSIDEDREFVESKIDTSKLTFVSDEYDPVRARENNLSLQEAYEESLETGVTHETSMIQMLISGVDISEGDNAYERIGEVLSHSRERFIADSSERLRKMDERIAALDDNTLYTDEQKRALRAKWELRKERIIETCEARERAVDRAQISLSEAHEMGCETKDEFVEVVGYITEAKTSSNPVDIQRAESSIDAFKESKDSTKSETASIGDDKKVLVYKPSDTSSAGDSGSSTDGGFASSINLLIVIGMLVLFGIIVCFLIR